MKRMTKATLLTLGLALGMGTAHAQTSDTDNEIAIDHGSCSQDVNWMKKMAQDNLFEISLGQLAQHKAKEDEVQKFGARLAKDHTDAMEDLVALAHRKGIHLPQDMSEDQMIVYQYFKNSDSRDWDHDYVEFEIPDHQAGIEDTKREIAHGCNSMTKALARKVLPVLEDHLKRAQDLDEDLDHHN